MASAESIVDAALAALADGRVYPDVAPAGAVKPYIVYQGVGGVDETTLDGPDTLQNCRMQIAVWSTTRAEAATIMQEIRQAMTAAPVLGTPIGAPVPDYESDTKLYGSRLDVSIWFNV
ncbi:DUF3168 domain-containing protein [Paraburkholderia sp. BCC1884]|uniref:DUF3168 domain-containing protein n=1 Tax=Paraburkholderia sp. BCC1884 TaxID=2562668 RepID=UPI001181F05F|nr:DUF3168 domain-containing protein [Paraburkholderia sp. BCC1884]